MAADDSLVVIGASAGGVEALTRLVGRLPADLPAAVAVVLHVAPGGSSVLASILARHGALPADPASDGAALTPGRIVVAVPDHHLTVQDGHVSTPFGPRENGHRPSVDVLFRSAAEQFRSRVTAVVVSGTRDDGTLGAAAVKRAGGRVLVQDPADCLYPGMPSSVMRNVAVDGVGTPEELAALIARDGEASEEDDMDPVDEPEGDPTPTPADGEASGLTCPECGGAIWISESIGVMQFECHVGHVYSAESMADEQSRSTEQALWSAIRQLDERAALLRRVQENLRARGSPALDHFERQAMEAERDADIIRGLIRGSME